MARTEPIYRHHDERLDASANGRLACPVSGRTQGRLEVRTARHRQTLRTKPRVCLKSNHRTRTPGTGSDFASGRAESGAFVVSREGTEQTLNTRDAGVTLTCDVQLRLPVTYASHIPEGISRRVIPCSNELRNPPSV